MSILSTRGGIQLKPITIISANKFNKPENANAVLNTTFTIIKTITKNEIQLTNYFPENYVLEKSDVIKMNDSIVNDEAKPNIVLIILESFSKKHVNSKTTPFLDSLKNQSLNFENAYANAKKSIEGIPAIISSLPALSITPFIQSNYATNDITSLPNLLKILGYKSTFYHGGTNGTMGFDSYSKVAGFDNYKGLSEYPYKGDDDGTWGVFDEPYLQYFADECSSTTEPFFNTVFTLSSHHPYTIPNKYKNRFKNPNKIENTISYTDYALKEFFKKAKNTKWFKNTIFIITADHTAAEKANFKSVFQIPLIVYQYNNQPNTINKVVNQIDILPMIMEKVNYSKSYFSFGKKLDSTKNYSVNYLGNLYQITDNEYLLSFDGEKTVCLFNHIKDPMNKNNLVGTMPIKEKELEDILKIKIQEYNFCLVNNKMTTKSFNE